MIKGQFYKTKSLKYFMDKKYLLGLLFLASFLMFSSVSAQADQVYDTDPQLRAYATQGYIIAPIMISEGVMNEDIYLNFRVYDDKLDLIPVTDTTVNCSVFMFSPRGKRVYRFDGNEELSNISLTGRQAMFPGSFFNESGYYKWFVGCEHGPTADGGAFQGETFVSASGFSTKDTTVFYIIVLALGYILNLIGFFNRNTYITILGGIILIFVGFFILQNGLSLFRNNLTLAISYVTLFWGAGSSLWAAIEEIQENM